MTKTFGNYARSFVGGLVLGVASLLPACVSQPTHITQDSNYESSSTAEVEDANGQKINYQATDPDLARLPRNLTKFLSEKHVTIRKLQGSSLSVDEGNGAHIFAGGTYDDNNNTITLPETYVLTYLEHEAGHALWDTVGNDGIFDTFFSNIYSGPSKQKFIREMLPSDEYAEQELRVLERASLRVYAKLISLELPSETMEDVHVLQFTASNSRDPLLYRVFLNFARNMGAEIATEQQIEELALDETFSSSFASWVGGEETSLDPLFESMRVYGKPLKE